MNTIRRALTAVSAVLLLAIHASSQTAWDVGMTPKTFDVTMYGLIPDDGVDDTAAFYHIFRAVAQSGDTLHFPPGVYDFTPTQPQADYGNLVLSGLSSITLEGDSGGQTYFTMHSLTLPGIAIYNSDGVKLRNLTIQYVERPFTQGAVSYKDPTGGYVNITISPPYHKPFAASDPYLDQYSHNVLFHDAASLRPKDGIEQCYLPTFGNSRFVRLPNGDVQVLFNGNYSNILASVDLGDIALVKALSANGIESIGCTNLLFDHVGIQQSPGLGFLESNCRGNSYNACAIEPAGADLLSSNADGIRCVNSRGGPSITSCSFYRTGDDAIAIHGNFFHIVDHADGGKRLDLTSKNDPGVAAGDVFEFFSAANYATISTATVVSAKSAWDPATQQVLFTITFSTATGAFTGDFAVDTAALAPNFNIQGNTIRTHRARGILVKGSNGVISDNIISGCSMAGILLGPEFYWDEAAWVRNVDIYNNVVSDTGWAPNVITQAGGIVVSSTPGSPAQTPGVNGIALQNQHITIHHNTIKQSAHAGLLLTNVKGAQVFENEIWSSHVGPALPNWMLGFGMSTPASAVHAESCANVSIHDNRIEPAAGHLEFTKIACTNVRFRNNRRVFHTSFEAAGFPGWPSVGAAYWYNIHNPFWTQTEDAISFTMQYWGVFGVDTVWPFYIDRQTTQCSYNQGSIELTISNPTAVEFSIGSNALSNELTTIVEIEPAGSGIPTTLAIYKNASPDLDASAAAPFWSHKIVPLAVPAGSYKIRFRRSSPPGLDGGSPYVYIDDLVVRQDALPNQ